MITNLIPKTPLGWLAAIVAVTALLYILRLIYIVFFMPCQGCMEGFYQENASGEPIETTGTAGGVTAEAEESASPENQELIAAAQAAVSTAGSGNLSVPDVVGEEGETQPESEPTPVADRVLPTDDMIHLEPVVISTTNPAGPVSETAERTSEREGFNGGSVGSVMFDKIRQE